jgi:hypothetical protein
MCQGCGTRRLHGVYCRPETRVLGGPLPQNPRPPRTPTPGCFPSAAACDLQCTPAAVPWPGLVLLLLMRMCIRAGDRLVAQVRVPATKKHTEASFKGGMHLPHNAAMLAHICHGRRASCVCWTVEPATGSLLRLPRMQSNCSAWVLAGQVPSAAAQQLGLLLRV